VAPCVIASAPRMAGEGEQSTLSEAVRGYREAPDPPVRARAREQVAACVHALALRVLRSQSVPAHEAEDVAQMLTHRLTERLALGDVQQPEGFVVRSAINAALDHRRALKRNREVPTEDISQHAGQVDARDEADGSVEADERWTQVRALLAEMPVNYRRAIEAIDVQGRSADQLAGDVLRERTLAGTAGADPAGDRLRARNQVDAWHSRGRAWVRKELGIELAKRKEGSS
jgi:DNA-directed RNA polymerase specialized sigma24 family protein